MFLRVVKSRGRRRDATLFTQAFEGQTPQPHFSKLLDAEATRLRSMFGTLEPVYVELESSQKGGGGAYRGGQSACYGVTEQRESDNNPWYDWRMTVRPDLLWSKPFTMPPSWIMNTKLKSQFDSFGSPLLQLDLAPISKVSSEEGVITRVRRRGTPTKMVHAPFSVRICRLGQVYGPILDTMDLMWSSLLARLNTTTFSVHRSHASCIICACGRTHLQGRSVT